MGNENAAIGNGSEQESEDLLWTYIMLKLEYFKSLFTWVIAL